MSRVPLTRDRILDAALGLADARGLEALSMRRVGEVLGVEAMSLYHHVANKERMLDGVIDRVFAEIQLPPSDLGWQSALKVRATSVHHVLKRHPWATPLMESRSQPGPATLGHHNAVLGCLRQAGFTVAQAAHAISVLDAYIYGFALQQRALPFDTPEEAHAVATAMMAEFPVAQFPYLAEIMTEHVLGSKYDYDAEFEVGLDLVLEGVARMLARDGSQNMQVNLS